MGKDKEGRMMPHVRFQGESRAYRKHRDRLLEAEIALKDQRERIAALRRELPQGPEVQSDYIFREGPADKNDNNPKNCVDTRLSELFSHDKYRLIVYHMMYEPDADMARPMCSMWIDGYNAIVPHLTQTVNFVVIAKAEIGKLRAWGQRRGWKNLRLLSSYHTPFNSDFHVETEEGQLPALSVFLREKNKKIHHFYTTEASLEYRHHRGLDLYTPVWNLLDLLPEGRGEWMPKHFYAEEKEETGETKQGGAHECHDRQ